jgi:hypothetical protein
MSAVRALIDLLWAVRGTVTVAAGRAGPRARALVALACLALLAGGGTALVVAVTGPGDRPDDAAPTGADADAAFTPGGGLPVPREAPAAVPGLVPGGTTPVVPDVAAGALHDGTGAAVDAPAVPAADPAATAPPAEVVPPPATTTSTSRPGPSTTTTTPASEDDAGLVGSLLDALLGG